MSKTKAISIPSSQIIQETVEFILFSFLAILVPFLLEKPQLLVGSAVNAILVLSALKISDWKKLLPLIIFPSLSTLARNVIFGPFTFYLVYMIPFIWLGNAALVYSPQKIKDKKIALIVAGVSKVVIIFSAAKIYVSLAILPKIFLKTMGSFQLITFIIGATTALMINNVVRIKLKNYGS